MQFDYNRHVQICEIFTNTLHINEVKTREIISGFPLGEWLKIITITSFLPSSQHGLHFCTRTYLDIRRFASLLAKVFRVHCAWFPCSTNIKWMTLYNCKMVECCENQQSINQFDYRVHSQN
jgi:hypothetical protein